MTFEDYKNWVLTRVNVDRSMLIGADPFAVTIALAATGLAGETGEVVDLLKKNLFHGRNFPDADLTKLRLELGDLLWYYALLCKQLGFTLDDIIEANRDKLMKRDGVVNENFHKARI